VASAIPKLETCSDEKIRGYFQGT